MLPAILCIPDSVLSEYYFNRPLTPCVLAFARETW